MKSSFLDDGSTDDSGRSFEQFAAENPNVKGIRFMKNLNQGFTCWFCKKPR
jgi:glycosyltransferase involved in cell wall biosynthesis